MSRLSPILFVLTLLGCQGDEPSPNDDDTDTDTDTDVLPACDESHPDHTVGLKLCTEEAQQGYTLFAPLGTESTYLMDMTGHLVHEWPGVWSPGNAVYLEADGSLLRSENPGKAAGSTIDAGGAGGHVVHRSWDGEKLWEFTYNTTTVRQHHDIERLPNGNVLLVAWELKTEAEAIAAGRKPNLLVEGELWPDHLIEVDPSSDEIVWEWHSWDHLVQEHDASKDNFGVVADHPELIDINYTGRMGPNAGKADFSHVNSVDYNPDTDQIVLSSHNQHEIWIIDHSTTTEEAAGHSGGRYGRGGDLLYRWGNPAAYQAGSRADQELGGQHDARWIEPGYPGEGNILIFNNGTHRDYSNIVEITPPMNEDGSYTYTGSAWGPASPTWTYEAPTPQSFKADHISGSQRLSNGNTLICSGPQGRFFEVTEEGVVVWEYVNPVTKDGPIQQGDSPPTGAGSGSGNQVFRAWRHTPNDPAFEGVDLVPGESLVGGE